MDKWLASYKAKVLPVQKQPTAQAEPTTNKTSGDQENQEKTSTEEVVQPDQNKPPAETENDAVSIDDQDQEDLETTLTKESTTKTIPKKRKKKLDGGQSEKKKGRFVETWLDHPELKGWLARTDDTTHAFCKVCQCSIISHKSLLIAHCQTEKHRFNYTKVSENKKITDLYKNSQEKDIIIRKAEIKLCGMLATNNLPFLLMDTLCPLLKDCFPDSKIAQGLSVKRTKATAIVREGLGDIFLNNLYAKLRVPGCFFSTVLDETTDISTKKQCAFSVIYYDSESHQVKTDFFDLLEVKGTTANELYEVLKNAIISKGIPYSNFVGFSTDTTNVMAGGFHSVYTLLKEDLPDIVYVKCSCHMAHLAASKACLKLPKSVEDLLRNIASHFNRSPARKQKFEEFQNFFQVELHKILSPSQTRWLSVKACVDRVLEQYNPLEAYLRESVFEDPSYITDNMLKTMVNPFTKIYLEFLSYSLDLMTKFNLLFQSEKPLLHRVKPETESLLKTLCLNYMDASVIRKHNNIFTMNHQNPQNFLPLEKIYLGISATNSFLEVKNDPNIDKKDCEKFLTSILSFYIELVSQIKDRFQFQDKIYDNLEVVEPKTAQSFEHKSLTDIFKRFPILKTYIDLQQADNEWRRHALLDFERLGLNSNQAEADKYWSNVFKLKNEADIKLFPNLETIFSLLLVLPFSNACVERIFSDLFNIKADKRNLLTTENVRGILATKDGIENSGGCVKFMPSNSMLNAKIWRKNE